MNKKQNKQIVVCSSRVYSANEGKASFATTEWGRASSATTKQGKVNFATTGILFFLFILHPSSFLQAGVPGFQAAGTAVNGTGSVTPAWPAHQTGDIALLFVEALGDQPISLTTPNGFVEVLNSPQFTGTGNAGTRISVFWARATSSAMAAPVVADPGNHAYAVILTFRGVTPADDPWDVTAGGVKPTASVSVTATGAITTSSDTLIAVGVTKDLDSVAAFASNWTNANLANITERFDAGTTSGNGGGIAVMTGVKETQGTTGDTTADVTSSINAFLTIALKPIPPPVITLPITNVAARNMTASWGVVNGATGYTLAASINPDDPPSSFYASSTTLGDLSAKIDTPALNANTTYYLFVRSNGPGNSSRWAAYPGTSTLVEFAPVFNNFTNVGINAIQFNWTDTNNPSGTRYRVLTSTVDNPSTFPAGAVVTSSYTYNLYVSSSGLKANTTYYFQVAAVNNNDVPTSYTSSKGTSTLVEFAPVFNNFTNISANAIQFNWTDINNPAGTLYRVLASTVDNPATFPQGAVVTSSYTYNLYLSSSGLNANTTYYFQVAAVNHNNVPTSYTGVQSTSTFAIMPTDVNFTGITANAIQFNWTDTNNPSGTLYRVLTSTVDNPATFPQGAVVTSS
ncbi:MAG: fibronectin type III domain-containing protein, partial [Elusimicrobia bacterium]|nr:fibronectin type III domain-containing protein [Elusimicrobiota bacterium]